MEESLMKSVQMVSGEGNEISVQIESIWGNTLFNLHDLPFNPKEGGAKVFGAFYKTNESLVREL